MTVSITNWYTAGARINEIREACVAFQRGDQPEKIDHLTKKEVTELFRTAEAIVAFCTASLQKRRQARLTHRGDETFHQRELEFRDHETFHHARSYGKTLAHVLLHRQDVGPRERRKLEKWLTTERDLPSIGIVCV